MKANIDIKHTHILQMSYMEDFPIFAWNEKQSLLFSHNLKPVLLNYSGKYPKTRISAEGYFVDLYDNLYKINGNQVDLLFHNGGMAHGDLFTRDYVISETYFFNRISTTIFFFNPGSSLEFPGLINYYNTNYGLINDGARGSNYKLVKINWQLDGYETETIGVDFEGDILRIEFIAQNRIWVEYKNQDNFIFDLSGSLIFGPERTEGEFQISGYDQIIRVKKFEEIRNYDTKSIIFLKIVVSGE